MDEQFDPIQQSILKQFESKLDDIVKWLKRRIPRRTFHRIKWTNIDPIPIENIAETEQIVRRILQRYIQTELNTTKIWYEGISILAKFDAKTNTFNIEVEVFLKDQLR